MKNQLHRIRSFVRRQGRMSPAQKAAFANLHGKYCLELQETPYDFSRIFARSAPLVLEIGFGMGGSLAQMATESPGSNFIGVEIHKPGIGSLLKQIDAIHLENLRVFDEDVTSVINQCIMDETLDRVQIYFPDPWPKKRHHKRRLIQSEFLELLLPKLKRGGLIHLVTDWEHYAEQMVCVLDQCSDLLRSDKSKFLQEIGRPETKFERRGKKLNHQIFEYLYAKS